MAQSPAAYVQARVDGRVRHCLLDSGADISLIPSHFVSSGKISPNNRSVLAANNTSINVDGQASLSVVLDGHKTTATFMLSPNVDEVILGRDWLQQNQVVWDFGENRVHVNGRPCKLRTRARETPRCKRCRVGADIKIPPCGETVIPADIVYSHFRLKTDEGQWTTVPSEPTPGLRVARTLINADSPTIAVRVCNTTQRPIHLHKGQNVGTLQGVSTVSGSRPATTEISEADRSLQAMVDQVDSSVPDGVKDQLSTLINNYRDVFSFSEFDLGCTDIVHHEIDTGDNRPFKQALRPQPRAHLPAIDRLIDEMQTQGIIEPCQSEWASNIVLVKKKGREYQILHRLS